MTVATNSDRDYRYGYEGALDRCATMTTTELFCSIRFSFVAILQAASSPAYIEGLQDGLTDLIIERMNERPLSDFLEEF